MRSPTSPFSKRFKKVLAGHGIALTVLVLATVYTVSVRGSDLASLASAATSSFMHATTLYFIPYDENTLTVGEEINVDVNINSRVPINALGTTIGFPQDTLEVVGISKRKSFLDLWTEETAIKEDSGEVHFSAGTLTKGGLIGTGTAITLTVRAKKPGSATLSFKDVSVFAHDGKGTPVSHEIRTLTFKITEPPQPVAGGGDIVAAPAPTPRLKADFDGNGTTTIVDVSILAFMIFGPYNALFDLNMDGYVGLADLSILFSHVQGF